MRRAVEEEHLGRYYVQPGATGLQLASPPQSRTPHVICQGALGLQNEGQGGRGQGQIVRREWGGNDTPALVGMRHPRGGAPRHPSPETRTTAGSKTQE